MMKFTPVFNFHRYSGDFHTRAAHSSLAILRACIHKNLFNISNSGPNEVPTTGFSCIPHSVRGLLSSIQSVSLASCMSHPQVQSLVNSFPLNLIQMHPFLSSPTAVALVQAIALSYWATGNTGAAIWIDPIPFL